MRMRLAWILAAGLAASAAGAVCAQAPAPNFATPNTSPQGVRSMASACAMCHGTEGRAAPNSTVAALAGRPKDEIVQSMGQFKSGQKPATIMHQIAKGYSDAEIAALAAYFSALPR
jgi:sulfide dehydrogenase cytochrome subunit